MANWTPVAKTAFAEVEYSAALLAVRLKGEGRTLIVTLERLIELVRKDQEVTHG